MLLLSHNEKSSNSSFPFLILLFPMKGCHLHLPSESIIDKTSDGEKQALEHQIKTLSQSTLIKRVLSTYSAGKYESLRTLYR